MSGAGRLNALGGDGVQPFYADDRTTLYRGDALAVLRELPDASVDAVVTDPPYELGFMGRSWDASGIAYSVDLWREAWRVLKAGGHLLAFGGTRTVHRLTCAIEDAGFEIRDGIDWLYASGFPKSLDVSKAIDKARDDRADINRVTGWLAAQRDRAGLTNREIDAAFGFNGMAGHWTAAPHLKVAQVPRWEQWEKLRDLIGFGDEMDAEVWRLNGRKGTPGEAWAQREVIGRRHGLAGGGFGNVGHGLRGAPDAVADTAPATDDARRWQGWGTALKPAREPIVMARKPLAGTVAANVLAHGTGALNIDACRVEMSDADRVKIDGMGGFGAAGWQPADGGPARSTLDAAERSGPLTSLGAKAHAAGRWPSNVVLSHAPDCGDVCQPGCPVAELDRQSGVLKSGDLKPYISKSGRSGGLMGEPAERDHDFTRAGDSGGASRFFPVFRYQAKAPTRERPKVDGVAHPTVKPLALMRWLVRLVTPPGGTVLEPFAGSGTTAEACVLEGFRCIAIERDETYLPLIKARLNRHTADQLDLLGTAAA